MRFVRNQESFFQRRQLAAVVSLVLSAFSNPHPNGELERRTEAGTGELAGSGALPSARERFHDSVAEVAGTLSDFTSIRVRHSEHVTLSDAIGQDTS